MSKLSVALTMLAVTSAPASAAPIFSDWTSADFGANVAIGNLGGATVTLNACDTNYAVLDGSSTGYANANYTPALALSDTVEVLGHGVTPYANSVTFSAPVTNIVLHIASLASTLTFTLRDNTPIPVVYVSGSIGAGGVVGNSVIGQLSNSGPSACPTDVCGTVTLLGTFTAFNFTSFYHTWPGGQAAPVDGIGLQIGAESVQLDQSAPAPGALSLLALGLLGLRRRRAIA